MYFIKTQWLNKCNVFLFLTAMDSLQESGLDIPNAASGNMTLNSTESMSLSENYSEPWWMVDGASKVYKAHHLVYTRDVIYFYVPQLIWIIGTILNILSFVVFRRQSMRGTFTGYLFAMLAIFDTFALSECFLYASNTFEISQVFAYSKWICGVLSWFWVSSKTISAFILVGISMERLLCVIIPHKVKLWCTLKSAKIFCIILSILTAAIFSPYIFMFGPKSGRLLVTDSKVYRCSIIRIPAYNKLAKVYVWISLTTYSLLPFCFLLIANVLIIINLWRAHIKRKEYKARNLHVTNKKMTTTVSNIKYKSQDAANTQNQDTSDTTKIANISETITDERSAKDGNSNGHKSNVRSNFNDKAKVSGGQKDKLSSTRNKHNDMTTVTSMLICVSITFIILTLPDCVAFLHQSTTTKYEIIMFGSLEAQMLFGAIGTILQLSQHAVNFLLYCLSGSRFRKEVKEMLCIKGT